jgi:hypothetical protein
VVALAAFFPARAVHGSRFLSFAPFLHAFSYTHHNTPARSS